MAFKDSDKEIRKLTTQQLLELIPQSAKRLLSEQVIIGDELLLRRVKLTGFVRRFETMVRSLSTQDLRYIDRFDYSFSRAAIRGAAHELNKRGVKALNWFYLTDGQQHGPMGRMAIEQAIEQGQVTSQDLVWKESEPEWIKLANCHCLSTAYYFDEELLDIPQTVNRAPGSKLPGSSDPSLMLVGGVFELLTFPFWLFALFIVPFASFSSTTGVILPTVLAIGACFMSIPIGIGLILKRKWAYSFKVGSGFIIIAWLLSRIIIDGGSKLWMLYILAEVVILVLIISGREIFNTNHYESTT
jgi:hypothetical protein